MAKKKTFDSASAADQSTPKTALLPMKGANSFKKWLGRIDASQQKIADLKPEWDRNLRRYLNKKRETQRDDEMLVPTLYQRVEQKKAWLLPATPTVVASAKHPDAEPVAPLVEAVLNDVLTAPQPDGVDAMIALEEVMCDMLAGSGIFAVSIGYENVIDGTKQIQTGQQPDPNWVAPDPSMLPPNTPPPQPPMVPTFETVPNVVAETYYLNRLSPAKLLVPDDFTGADYDRAAWLGFEFLIDEHLAKAKQWNIPDDYDSFVMDDDDDALLNAGSREHTRSGDNRQKIRGFCIFYKAAIFDPSVKNPYQQRLLIILEDLKKPVEHKDSPYQWLEPDGTLGGMVGFPIHVGALRYVSDSAFPPSDASMSVYQEEEISDGRNDMKLQRKRNVPLRVANVTRLKEAGIRKIESAPYGAIIPLDDTAFGENGKPPIADVQQFAYPQENFSFDTINQRDLDATWGAGSGAGGAIPTGTASTSATQAGAANQTATDRRERERSKFMQWYGRAVSKLLPLYQRFMTDTQYVKMLGRDANGTMLETLKPWRSDLIQGKFALTVLPKASVAEADLRQDELNWYNQVAKSPNIDLRALDTELVRSFGKDPSKIIKPVTPPPPPPPALPHGFTLDVTKLLAAGPLSPDYELGVEILRQSGIVVPPDVIARAQQQAMKTGITPSPTKDAVNGQVVPPPTPQPPSGPQPPAPPPQHPGAMPTADVVDKNFATHNPGGLPGATK